MHFSVTFMKKTAKDYNTKFEWNENTSWKPPITYYVYASKPMLVTVQAQYHMAGKNWNLQAVLYSSNNLSHLFWKSDGFKAFFFLRLECFGNVLQTLS